VAATGLDATEQPAHTHHHLHGDHQLRAEVVQLFDSAVMGMAGSAPGYSIAASTAVLFGAVGLAGPASLLYCGIAMFGIVWAFNYLGQSEVNAGASYAWVRRAIHPALGYIAGWSLVVSALIFMVAAALPAGSDTLDLFSSRLAASTGYVTIVGIAFFLLMVVAVLVGVKVTTRVQVIMSSVEVVILTVFAALALTHGVRAHTFHWSWLSPRSFHGVGGFFSGALIAAFYYWGWDVTANLNEETRSAQKTPGIGGVLGMAVAFLLFESFTIGTNLVLSAKAVNAAGSNVLVVLGQQVWSGVGGKFIVLAVVLSTFGTLETTLIQGTRAIYAMGRDGTLPRSFGKVHAGWRTPWVTTLTFAVIAIALFLGSQFIGSVSNIMTDAINAIGEQVCVYYGLAGLSACVLFRRQILKSPKNFLLMGLWPFAGAVFMLVMLVRVVPSLNATENIVGLGAIAIGLVPMTIYWVKGREYFTVVPLAERIAPEIDR
jgi:amino acid transporter